MGGEEEKGGGQPGPRWGRCRPILTAWMEPDERTETMDNLLERPSPHEHTHAHGTKKRTSIPFSSAESAAPVLASRTTASAVAGRSIFPRAK